MQVPIFSDPLEGPDAQSVTPSASLRRLGEVVDAVIALDFLTGDGARAA